MNALQESLADYVRRVIAEKGLNYREVARRAEGVISHSTVFDVINERNKNVSARTLKGLATGLGITEDEIFAVARGISLSEPSLEEQHLLSCFRSLPHERKSDALAYLRLLAQRYGGGKHKEPAHVGARPVYKAIAGIPKSLKVKGRKPAAKKST